MDGRVLKRTLKIHLGKIYVTKIDGKVVQNENVENNSASV
jgi:hypothetical protein